MAFSTEMLEFCVKLKAENGWDQCWKEGVTPWDMGGVTPVIQDLVDKGKLPQGRALVPGCGIVSFLSASDSSPALGFQSYFLHMCF